MFVKQDHSITVIYCLLRGIIRRSTYNARALLFCWYWNQPLLLYYIDCLTPDSERDVFNNDCQVYRNSDLIKQFKKSGKYNEKWT